MLIDSIKDTVRHGRLCVEISFINGQRDVLDLRVLVKSFPDMKRDIRAFDDGLASARQAMVQVVLVPINSIGVDRPAALVTALLGEDPESIVQVSGDIRFSRWEQSDDFLVRIIVVWKRKLWDVGRRGLHHCGHKFLVEDGTDLLDIQLLLLVEVCQEGDHYFAVVC